MQVDKPKPITQFLDDLRVAGQSIVPDSLIWIPDPANPGRLIAAVMIEDAVAASRVPAATEAA